MAWIGVDLRKHHIGFDRDLQTNLMLLLFGVCGFVAAIGILLWLRAVGKKLDLAL